MRIKASLVAAAICIIGATGSRVFAESPAETFDLKADRIEVLDRTHKVVFTGGVRARQGTMLIEANSAIANYTGQLLGSGEKLELNRVDARGGVKITRPTETATGNFAIYDLNRRVVIMLGNVTLRRPGNYVNGSRLTLDLDTNRAVMNGSTSGSEPVNPSIKDSPGRVSGSFTVPQKKVPASAMDSSPP